MQGPARRPTGTHTRKRPDITIPSLLKKESVFEKFSEIGIQKTYSADSITTDSGASATAFSSGEKANNRMIGMTPGGRELYSIMEEAMNRDMYSGLVVSSTIVHATPAPFYAHTESRYNYEEIALALLEKQPDYFVRLIAKWAKDRNLC